MMKTYALTGMIFLGLLTACSHPKINSETLPAPLVKNEMNGSVVENIAIKSWELSGAIAVKGPSKAWSAQINWLQSGPHQYQIRLFGPLGGGTVMIEGNNGHITYTDGPKKVLSKNAEELLEKETGLRLPVHNLYYWVRSLPAPGSKPTSTFGPNHTLTTLQQDGYRITYLNYTTVHQAVLPSKIRLEGHGLLIKLVIKHWRV